MFFTKNEPRPMSLKKIMNSLIFLLIKSESGSHRPEHHTRVKYVFFVMSCNTLFLFCTSYKLIVINGSPMYNECKQRRLQAAALASVFPLPIRQPISFQYVASLTHTDQSHERLGSVAEIFSRGCLGWFAHWTAGKCEYVVKCIISVLSNVFKSIVIPRKWW